MSMDKGRIPNGAAIDFVSSFQDVFFETISQHLGTFIQDGFLKDLYEKQPTTPVDKAQMLIDRFGKSANPQKFIEQARSLNIQPTTLSLIFSIAFSVASRSWDNFTTHFYMEFGDMGNKVNPDFFDESEDDERNEAELGSQLNKIWLQIPNPKDKQKARVTVDKQVKNQSTTAKPDAKTSAKNSQKDKKSSDTEVTQILTGYEAVGDEQERIRDIIVYDIPYTWNLQKILAELKFWGTLLNVPLNGNINLGGIPVRWFPASWTLRERKQRENITSAFKIIQTSKGRRKLVGYFENWETTLKALDSPPVTLPLGKELKWCRHSIPNLKKARKLKTKNTPDMKTSGNTGNAPDSNKSKKKDQVPSSTSNKKKDNQLKDPQAQKKAKNSSKSKGRDKGNQVVLAEILSFCVD
ncbi:hypothetical protein RhiirA1_460878 [Rhizophagus irregularis]|uniref:Uncharacterized protein n=1 Tax=Rhizophagus irregularis TaxID=588596 RepID=A0A2N0RQH6_9GLOM|nr:hypothetical protein RhiirA1_460878 [Rhizophagus irregularis]